MNVLKTVDLFAGCGGMSLGFQSAGFKIVAAFDNWQPAIKVYSKNFRNHPMISADLNSKESHELVSRFSPDVIIGGPPCQDFSSAGSRDETRGRANLTISFAELIVDIKPRFFVMENVDRITLSNALQVALAKFRSAGYGLTFQVLEASYCGVPQFRKRFFLIGELGGYDDALTPYLLGFLSSKPMTLRDYFGDKLGVTHYYRHPWSYKRRAVFSIDEPSPTIRGVNRPVPRGYPGHPLDAVPLSQGIRPLTTIERSYIQTFPKEFDWEGSKTDLEQMIGNAVPVKLAEYVARSIRMYLADREKHSDHRSVFANASANA